jgi:Uma2 family endonuclease
MSGSSGIAPAVYHRDMPTVEEYLHTLYRPDCDYLDGEVCERNVGEFDHGRAQMETMVWLCARTSRHRVLPSLRLQITPTRFRVPDVCVLAEGAPREQIPRTPPMLCMEILSKDDRMSDILERVKDYFEMGVPTCWIIDPATRTGWTATPGNLAEATDGILRAADLEMLLAEILP